jgi:hypothetical protein
VPCEAREDRLSEIGEALREDLREAKRTFNSPRLFGSTTTKRDGPAPRRLVRPHKHGGAPTVLSVDRVSESMPESMPVPDLERWFGAEVRELIEAVAQ